MRSSFLSQNANQKLQGFLPYQTNKDHSQKTAYLHQKITRNKCYDACVFGRTEILVIFCLHFGRNNLLWCKFLIRNWNEVKMTTFSRHICINILQFETGLPNQKKILISNEMLDHQTKSTYASQYKKQK